MLHLYSSLEWKTEGALYLWLQDVKCNFLSITYVLKRKCCLEAPLLKYLMLRRNWLNKCDFHANSVFTDTTTLWDSAWSVSLPVSCQINHQVSQTSGNPNFLIIYWMNPDLQRGQSPSLTLMLYPFFQAVVFPLPKGSPFSYCLGPINLIPLPPQESHSHVGSS